MSLTTYRRATALGERAWDRVFRRVSRGLPAREADRVRWRKMMDRAAQALEEAKAEAERWQHERTR